MTNGLPDQDALARVFADPNCFSFQEMFPGGFQPVFGGERTDASLVGGVRGYTASGTIWDVSVSAGSSEADFFLYDSVNASLGPDTPTAFDPGFYAQEEVSANFDVARNLSERLHLAAGLEWRNEGFEIGLGEPDSWRIGPYAQQSASSPTTSRPARRASTWSRHGSRRLGAGTRRSTSRST